MNKSDGPNWEETQFTRLYHISELPPNDNIKSHQLYRDYTVEDVQDAMNKIDTDHKDAMHFITHYMFT